MVPAINEKNGDSEAYLVNVAKEKQAGFPEPCLEEKGGDRDRLGDLTWRREIEIERVSGWRKQVVRDDGIKSVVFKALYGGRRWKFWREGNKISKHKKIIILFV